VCGTVAAAVTGTVVAATVVGALVDFGFGFVVVRTTVVTVVAVESIGVDLTAVFADEPQPARARIATAAMAARERSR
jgi:hypothetical protein